ncbi:MAG: allantoin racemase [Gammaproteobacteria bacterium]|jgi:Asp/Glu/hydantoin racemase
MKIWYQSFSDRESSPGYWRELERFMQENASPGTEFDFRGITPFDSYAHSLSEWRCGREAIANAITASDQNYDGYVMGHFQDSGLYEARAAASIPVMSLGEASMLYACQYGQRIGIITMNPRFIPMHQQQIRKYGLEDRVVGVHAMQFDPGEIVAAFDDKNKFEQVAEQFEAQAKPLVASGIDVLIPAGGIPMLLLSKIRNHQVDGAPVLNGLPVLLRMIEMAVEMRQKFGLEVSRSSEFVRPPREILDEFLEHPQIKKL